MNLSSLADTVRCSLYDKLHRVETCGKADLKNLRILSPNIHNGTDYRPTPPTTIRFLFKNLEIEFETTSFIDMGSGKGRCLLVAAEYPFKQVRGAEFSEDLHGVAVKNIATYRGKLHCKDIRSVFTDAGYFKFPQTQLLIHFFNPFTSAVMDCVLSNLERHPYPVLFAFLCGRYENDARESLRRRSIPLIKKTEYYEVFRGT